MLINTIVFLNFLIAVIGDVYNQVMETRTEEIYKRKADLLVEIQNVIGSCRKYEPAQILVTRSSLIQNTDNEWSGVLKDIKKCVALKS